MLSTTTTISHLITRSSDLDNCVDWLYNPLERERERERDGGYLEDNSLECHVCLTLNSRVYINLLVGLSDLSLCKDGVT